MINILELRPNPNSKSNGIDKYCKALRDLFANDNDITILPVENYPMKKNRFFKEMYKSGVLDKVLVDNDIDIVHINGFASLSVIQCFRYAKNSGKKIVYTAHWHPFQYLNHPLRSKVFFYFLLKPLIKKYADTVVTINNEDTAFFKRFHNNVWQIPHWIENNQSTCENLADKDPSMILFVGRFNDPNKGAEHLFQLPEGKYNIHCVGPCDGELRSDMTSHVNIPFKELSQLYAKASLLVVPSRYEAFSYVTLEALTYGTPVLLSNRVKIYDYLEGVQGVGVFHYHNYSEFNESVASYIGCPVNKASIINAFKSDNIKEQYRKLLTQVYTNNYK